MAAVGDDARQPIDAVPGAPALIRYADGAEARVVRDAAGRLVGLVDTGGATIGIERVADGRVTAVVDPRGHRTEVLHGPRGLARRIVDPLGHAVELAYDRAGHLVSLTDAVGAVWELAGTHEGRPSRVRGPDGSEWSVRRDPDGTVTELVDPLGGVTRRRREEGGRRTVITDPAGGDHRVTRDGAGRTVERVDPAGGVTRLLWGDQPTDTAGPVGADGAARSVLVVDADGVTRRSTWTADGRLASLEDGVGGVTRVVRAPGGRVEGIESPGGHRWTFHRDRRDRVVSAVAPSGRTVRIERDQAGRVAAVEVGTGRWSCRRDACGHVVALTDPSGSTWRWDRDAAGRVFSTTDPRGAVVRIGRDARGDVTVVVDPTGRPVTVTRDAMRRPVERRDPLGRLTTFRHDGRGRLVAVTTPTGEHVRAELDGRGDPVALTVDGHLEIRCERDAAGRLVTVLEPGRGRTQCFTWTAAGRLASWTSSPDHLSWEYDAAGRSVARRGMGDHRRLEYDADGRVVGVLSERLGPIRLTRDADGRLTALEAAGLRRWWRHDDRGLLIGYTEQIGSEVPRATRLNRDANGRVVDETGPRGEQALLGYDETGRLIARVDPAGVVRYEYDLAGNLVEERRVGAPVRRYGTDGAHGLVRIETGHAGEPGGDGPVVVDTDAAGRRVAERRGDDVRRFRYGPLGGLVGIDHPDGGSTVLDVDAFGRLVGIAEVTLAWAPGLVRRPVPDRFGDLHIHTVAGRPVAVTGTDDASTDQAVRWISTDWRGSVDTGAPDEVTAPSVVVDGLVWTGAGFHDPATGRDLVPLAAPVFGLWPDRRPHRSPRRRGDAVGRGMRVGHWDVGAVIRQLVLDEVGDVARPVMADAYDLTGLPGADPGGDVSAVAVRLLTGPGDDLAGPDGPVPAGGGFGNSAFPWFGRRS